MYYRKQRGLTLIGFVLLLILALFFAYIGMKLVPIYTQYYSVVKAMQGVADEPGAADMSPNRIRNAFFTRLGIDYVSGVEREHVRVTRNPVVTLNVAYEVREPLIGNIDIVVHFDRSQPLGNKP